MTEATNDLLAQIHYHNQKYWIDNEPEISDVEYDILVRRYLELGGDSSLVNTILQTNLSNTKFKHKTPMLSLDKAYSIDEVIEWAYQIVRHPYEEFELQLKYDGWAGKYYPNKNLLVTRGDGQVGENISSKIPLINFNIKDKYYPKDPEYFILGEIIITKPNFIKYKSKLLRSNGQEYKSERTCLTGLLSTKDNLQLDFKPLDFMDYNLQSYTFKYSELVDNSLNVETVKHLLNKQDCPIDGMVFKLKDKAYGHSLGFTSHHPKSAIALKFGNPTGQSKLIDIEWFVGKNNTINPVGIIEPVIIHGHEIQRVNLHNAKYILDLNLKIGDTVVIERCGEIIPDVKSVIQAAPEFRLDIELNECPECGSKLEYSEPFLYCSNPLCGGALAKKLNDSCSRLGVENIGLPTIRKMIEVLQCETIYDILTLTKDDIYKLPGFSDISVNNLYNEFQKVISKPVYDWQLLSALNINGIGVDMSKKLCQSRTLKQLYDMEPDHIVNLPNFGVTRAMALYDGLQDNHDLISNLLSILNIKDSNTINSNSKTICFTGKMEKPRSYYEKLALEHGYTPTNTVTKDLSVLVTSEPDRKSSKIDKAKKNGVQILTLGQWILNIGE